MGSIGAPVVSSTQGDPDTGAPGGLELREGRVLEGAVAAAGPRAELSWAGDKARGCSLAEGSRGKRASTGAATLEVDVRSSVSMAWLA